MSRAQRNVNTARGVVGSTSDTSRPREVRMGMATKQSRRKPRGGGGRASARPPILPEDEVHLETGAIKGESVIRFQVRGLPVPQGSLRSWVVNGKPVITSTAKGLGSWRRLVADVAQRFAPTEPWAGPVGIELDFGIPKPKSAPKRRRVWPDKRPVAGGFSTHGGRHTFVG